MTYGRVKIMIIVAVNNYLLCNYFMLALYVRLIFIALNIITNEVALQPRSRKYIF